VRETRGINMRNGNGTLLVPETQITPEEQFRQTFMTNFTRKTMVTARTDEEDSKLQGSPPNNNDESEENKSNNSTNSNEDDQVVAKYKILRDKETIGDAKLMEQESKTIKNLQNIIFFFLLIVSL